MHSDADLRLVAKAIGFQSKESGLVENEEPFDWFVYPNGRHSNGEPLPDLRNDDAEAARWLLPHLVDWAVENCADLHFKRGGRTWIAWLRSRPGMVDAGKLYGEVHGLPSFAAALFDLTLQLAKENQT